MRWEGGYRSRRRHSIGAVLADSRDGIPVNRALVRGLARTRVRSSATTGELPSTCPGVSVPRDGRRVVRSGGRDRLDPGRALTLETRSPGVYAVATSQAWAPPRRVSSPGQAAVAAARIIATITASRRRPIRRRGSATSRSVAAGREGRRHLPGRAAAGRPTAKGPRTTWPPTRDHVRPRPHKCCSRDWPRWTSGRR